MQNHDDETGRAQLLLQLMQHKSLPGVCWCGFFLETGSTVAAEISFKRCAAAAMLFVRVHVGNDKQLAICLAAAIVDIAKKHDHAKT